MARELRALGVKGTLVRAAELGYITELECGMPKCFCPEEWGGAAQVTSSGGPLAPGVIGSRPTITFKSQRER